MTPEGEGVLLPAKTARQGVRTWRADAALAGNTLIWGSTFVLVQAALKDISPILFLAIRFSIATVALALLFRGRARFRPTRGGMIAGGCLFAGYLFQTVGLQFTTASKSAFITGLAIPLVPLLTCLVYLSRPRVFELAGVVCATAGHGTDDASGRNAGNRTRRPADFLLRGGLCGAHHCAGTLSRARSVLSPCPSCRWRRPRRSGCLDFLVGRDAGNPVAARWS